MAGSGSRRRRLVAGAVAALIACAPAHAQILPSEAPAAPGLDIPPVQAIGCAPEGVVRIVVRNISPGLAASDPRAQPRTLMRQGNRYLRLEEDPDPARGQQVVIVAEPDIWTLNLATRQGQHRLDSDPTQIVRAPVIPSLQVPAVLGGLEYGCEPEFVQAHAPRPRSLARFGAIDAALHVVEEGGHSVAILMDPRRNTPLLVSYLREGKPMLVLRYDEYRAGLQMRESQFSPPRGVKFIEAPPAPTASPSE